MLKDIWFVIRGFGFGEPAILLLLLLIPLLIWVYIRYWEKKKEVYIKLGVLRKIAKIEHNKRKKIAKRMHLPFTLLLIAITFLIIALASPHIPLKKAGKGVNIVLAIDTSGSMSATDYKPSRLGAAKEAAKTLIEDLHDGDRVGIVTFSSTARTLCYLTPSKERAIEKLESLNKAQGATAIGDGLMLAIDMVTSIPSKKKIIVLLSDGVNNAGSISPLDAAEYAKKEGIKVYTVGLGSEKPVLLGYDFFGDPEYAKLDEKTLKEIAQITGGKYFKSINEDTLKEIYNTIGSSIKREWKEQNIANIFVWLALITLLLDAYLVYFKYKIIA